MKEYDCLDISFPNVSFDSYLVNTEKTASKHHAHLFTSGYEIELRLYFDSKTYFDSKLQNWLKSINWNDFGKHLHVEGSNQNDRVKLIDFSEASLLQIRSGSDQIDRKGQYVKLYLNYVKTYWQPREKKTNTAEFYLNEAGFHVVKDIYTFLTEVDEGRFNLNTRIDYKEPFKLEHGSFRLSYNFWIKDSVKSSEAKIIKEPRIEFCFTKEISESEILHYSEMIRLLSCFYYNLQIDYLTSKIYLKDETITIKRVIPNERVEDAGNLWTFFTNYFDFSHLLKSNWGSLSNDGFIKFKKAIEMHLQAISLDSTSRFLIHYNIIEVCMSGKKSVNDKFVPILVEPDLSEKYEEALNILLQTINPIDHNEFRKKWNGVSSKLSYKPMKGELLSFLEEQGLKPEQFPISISKLKAMRDSITHGSVSSFSTREIERANILLYRISVILLLNILDIKGWNLDLNIPE